MEEAKKITAEQEAELDECLEEFERAIDSGDLMKPENFTYNNYIEYENFSEKLKAAISAALIDENAAKMQRYYYECYKAAMEYAMAFEKIYFTPPAEDVTKFKTFQEFLEDVKE